MEDRLLTNNYFCGPTILKTCSKCLKEKPLEDYHKSYLHTYFRRPDCKVCKNTLVKKYYENHKPQRKIYKQKYGKLKKTELLSKKQKYRLLNVDKIKQYHKNYKQKNKDKILKYFREYNNKKLKTDNNFKITKRLRCRLYHALKGNAKRGSAIQDLGCSVDFLKQHLEAQFQPGMTWDNYNMHGWHIDHIRPLASFDLTDPEQLRAACHYTNLQPLWAADNISKGAKYA
jgi:hypothetical protein